MERLKSMKETLMSCVQAQLADVKSADTHELGEAIDMIKDLEEAMYYCSIVKAMEKSEKEQEMMSKMPREYHHYTERYIPYEGDIRYHMPYERDMDRDIGRMYYSERQGRNSRGEFTGNRYYDGNGSSSGMSGGSNSSSGMNGGSRSYHETQMPFDFRDYREGRSPMSRRNYMESKEMHQGKEKKLKELEKYMQELSEDIVEMIEGASPEEKQMLEKKMTNLTSKIAQLNTNV